MTEAVSISESVAFDPSQGPTYLVEEPGHLRIASTRPTPELVQEAVDRVRISIGTSDTDSGPPIEASFSNRQGHEAIESDAAASAQLDRLLAAMSIAGTGIESSLPYVAPSDQVDPIIAIDWGLR
jgi:hypothetical protein